MELRTSRLRRLLPQRQDSSEEPVPTRRLERTTNDCPNLATFQSSDSNFLQYRGFGYIHSRVLLDKQDEVRQLEDELECLDAAHAVSPSAERLDQYIPQSESLRARGVLLPEIRAKLLQYDQLLLKARDSITLRSPRQVHRASTKYDQICRGQLNGSPERVFIDSQADNYVSEEYLEDKHIPWDHGSARAIKVADGTHFKTLGKVSLPWIFKGETRQYNVDFSVLPRDYCLYNVTFGGSFMNRLHSLAKSANRILRIPRRSHLPRVCFQGSGQLRIDGFCDGQYVSASPDCASDVSLMSPAFADRLSRPVDRGDECCIELELPGNRVVRTAGMIRGVPWSFGDESYFVDFYILEGLPVDVLLDEQFLNDGNVFEDCAELLHELDEAQSGEHDGLFLLVRRLERSKPQKAAHGFRENLLAVFRRPASSSKSHEAEADFYARERLLVDQQRTINKSTDLNDDQKRAETERIRKELTLLQQSRLTDRSQSSASSSQSQSTSSVSTYPLAGSFSGNSS